MSIPINPVIRASFFSVQVDKQQHYFYDFAPTFFQQRYNFF